MMKNEDKKDEESKDEEEVEAKYQNPMLAFLPTTATGLISVIFWSSYMSSRR